MSLSGLSCSEAKARKAVTYNYACMLVLLVTQTSNELRMMEQYAAPLLAIAKADDTNAKLQGKILPLSHSSMLSLGMSVYTIICICLKIVWDDQKNHTHNSLSIELHIFLRVF